VVAAAEGVADLGQAVAGELLRQHHRHLARAGHGAAAALGQQVRDAHLVILGHRLLDVFDRDELVLQGDEVAQGIAREFQRDRAPREMGVGDHAAQRPFQFAHVRADALGDEKSDLVRQRGLRLFGLAMEDGHSRLQLRRLDGDRQSPAEARFQAFLQAVDLLRVAVAGQDQLLIPLQQCVKGVEELLLGTLLARKKLDVIDQQRIQRTIEALEVIDRVALQRLDHVGDEALRVQVDHAPTAAPP